MKENEKGIMTAAAGPAHNVDMATRTPSGLLANWKRSMGPPHLVNDEMLRPAYQVRRKA
jgi:hypothetical protein